MKKLMALAALAAAGAAFGACEYVPPETPVKETAWVYKWTFTGKTTYGVKPATTTTKAVTGLCGYKSEGSTTTADCAVRTPASLKIEGYTWVCTPGCGSIAFAEQFAEVNEIFWQKKPFKASLAGGVSTEFANIIGKKAKNVEAFGTASFTEFVDGSIQEGTYTLAYAGIGKYDTKNSRVKCCKGNFAGLLNQPHYISKTVCTNAGYWTCEDLSLDCLAASVAYGKWNAKFKKSASKKYLNKGITPKAPSWAVALNK